MTPRKVSRPSDNALLWRWDPDAFGNVASNQNPAGLGTFVYDLRFPGQIYLSETGLGYNYMRDYDAAIGRYVEADPMGQRLPFAITSLTRLSVRHAGYLNHLYNYVDNQPASLRDPRGLGIFDWFWDLFSDKGIEESTSSTVGRLMSALCIAQHCGQKRDSLELYGDCASILNGWQQKQGSEVIAGVSALTADGGQAAVSECAKLCEEGIKKGSCCKGGGDK